MRHAALSNDVLPRQVVRHGAYLCLKAAEIAHGSRAADELTALVERLGLRNEFEARDGHPDEAVAYLRRVDATPADIADAGLLAADTVVHVASASAAPVAEFCAEAARLLGPARVLGGVVRPTSYTGGAMHAFAYASQVLQQPGSAMPNAFLLPLLKTADWWAKATRWRRPRGCPASCGAPTRARRSPRPRARTTS